MAVQKTKPATKPKTSNEAVKEKKQPVEVVKEGGEVVVVEERRNGNVLSNVGKFVRRTWKPILGGVLAFGAGVLTALALSGGSEEPDYNDDEDDDYSILDEE